MIVPAPDPIPAWLVPWSVWAINGKVGNRPAAPRPIPGWATWFPAWAKWVYNGGRNPDSTLIRPPGAPAVVPKWAWAQYRLVAAELNKDHEAELAFFRRMAAWVTRIDHLPSSWLPDYSNGNYPVVILESMHGTQMQPRTGGEPPLTVSALHIYCLELQALGFKVCGSQWGTAVDPVAEAEAAINLLETIPFDGWVFNGEKPYEVAGKSAAYVSRFRQRFRHLPLGWSPEIRLALDHDVLQEHGVCYMPQVYVGEMPWQTLDFAVEWGLNFGYELENIIPLVQAYKTNDVRPSAVEYRDAAHRLGLEALVLYPANQCLDNKLWWQELAV